MGEKESADQAAVDAMRLVLDTVRMDGVVVIGEGEKDEAPMLYNGEQIGDGSPPAVDIAVDPLEGTRLTALGYPSALAVIALSERGTMFDPGPCVYMEKMAGSEEIADLLDLDRPLPETLKLIADRKQCDIRDVMVVMLDRERHEDAVKEIRGAGARIRFITDGDVSAALLAVSERTPVDLLWGIGGTPEGVISAAAIKCIGGRSWAACGHATTRSARRRSTRATTCTRRSTATGSWPATTCSSPPPASPTATCSRACATRARAARPRSRS
jgi:fructose-1,6-bisphosphatase II